MPVAREEQRAARVLTWVGAISSRRADAAFILVVVVAVAAVWVPRTHGPVEFRWDGGVYYTLATSLAQGKGYRLLNEPGEIAATQYPPLLPALVALHQHLLGATDFTVVGVALRATYFLQSVAYAVVTYLVVRRWLRPGWALFVSLFSGLHGVTLSFSEMCTADMPFALTSMLCLLCHQRCGRMFAVGAGVFAVTAYLLRTIGVTLMLASVIEALARRRFRTAAVRVIVAAVPVIAWHAYVASVERSPEYRSPAYPYQRADYMFYNVSYGRNVLLVNPFGPEYRSASLEMIARRALANVRPLWLVVGEVASSHWGHWQRARELVASIPGLRSFVPERGIGGALRVLGALVFIGLGLLLYRGEILVPTYVLGYLAVVCITPWPDQWARYLMPLVPLIALALCVALIAIRSWFRRSRLLEGTALVFIAGVILLAAALQALSIHHLYSDAMGSAEYATRDGRTLRYRVFFYRAVDRGLDAGIDWLQRHAAPDAVVVAAMPHWVYLRTGLRSVMPPFEHDPAKVAVLLDAVPARYVIVDGANDFNYVRLFAAPAVRAAPDRWKRVYADPPGRLEIYERVGDRPPVS